MSDAGDLGTRAEAVKAGESKFWQQQLELADKNHEEFLKQGREVVDRYKSDMRYGSPGSKSANRRKKFNILYSNVEVLKSALFARMAKPDVRRRFSDQDPTGRVISELIERALIYIDDVNDTEGNIELAVGDYCLPGRGVVRVQYKPTMATSEPPVDENGQTVLDETGQPLPGTEYVAKQELWDEYVQWDAYRHEPVPTWDKMTWEGYRHLMTLDDLLENFGDYLGDDEVKKIPLNWEPTLEGKNNKVPESFKKAETWEIWDKVTRTRVWVVKGYDKLCRKEKDPYGLEDFFPRPNPIQATTTSDTVIPQAEYFTYKDQADALDELETRIDRLTKALKRRGGYNSNIPELKKLANLDENHGGNRAQKQPPGSLAK